MSISAMILAAGRGERMRPLSDACPKPLLVVGGKPLIVWQIEALARAGFRDIVINAAHHADRLVDALGDGGAHGVSLRWSLEPEAYETAGGIVTALPLLAPGPFLVVSADIHTAFDYASLLPRAQAMARDSALPRAHLVMVPTSPRHPAGDFVLADGMLRLADGEKLVYGNIALHDTALFADLRPRTRIKLLPLWQEWIARGSVSGERYDGAWMNVGTPEDLMQLEAELRRGNAPAH
jgi:MurNAc alpha-1-phosphate uridylyltransferase